MQVFWLSLLRLLSQPDRASGICLTEANCLAYREAGITAAPHSRISQDSLCLDVIDDAVLGLYHGIY